MQRAKRRPKDEAVEATLRGWRPTVPSELPSTAADTALPTEVLIAAALKKLRLDDQINEAAVRKAWADIVGPALAKHSTPRGLRNGVLFVGVAHPTIFMELRTHLKKDVLARLREHLGANLVRDIVFRNEG
jgi:predicted nucleic acid-binding Zn ribbon protein